MEQTEVIEYSDKLEAELKVILKSKDKEHLRSQAQEWRRVR
jgi:hypothetical protein